MALVEGQASGDRDRYTVRVAVRESELGDWDPTQPISGLYLTEVSLDSYQNLQHGLAPVLRRALPGRIPDESVPRAERHVGWAVRRLSADSTTATVADYENPGLVWAVTPAGALYATHGLSHERSFMLGDVIAATRAGYDHHDWQDVLIWPTDFGRGGDTIWYDMVSFLQQQGVTVEALSVEGAKVAAAGAAGYYWRKLTRRFRSRKGDKQARFLARKWETRNITPYTLRRWFDSKTEWRIEEVAKRLELHPFAAQELLIALGYAHKDGGVWALGEARSAKKRRAKWLASEETEWLPEPY